MVHLVHAKRARRVLGALLGCAILVGSLASPSPRSARAAAGLRRDVTVLVPDAHDLRLLAFWVALGSGGFARHGLDVHVLPATAPNAARTMFAAGAAPVALLAGPDFERLISDRFSFVLAANLLQNDPTLLVLRREVAKRLEVNERMPVAQRLSLMRAIAVGVAVPDRARLYQLFRSQGGDADSTHLSVRKWGEQVAALQTGELDAAYLPTPYLEEALDHDALVIVDPAAGEIPAFAERLIEALAVTSSFAKARPADVDALVRAIAAAEHTIHFEPAAAAQAVVRAVPSVTAAHAARIVSLYAQAVPSTPHVEAQLIKREAAFYPVGGDVLNLAGLDLQSYVLENQPSITGGSPSAVAAPAGSRHTPALLGALVILIALLVVILDQREASREGTARGEVL